MRRCPSDSHDAKRIPGDAVSIVEQALQLWFKDESRDKRAEDTVGPFELDAVFEGAAVWTDGNHAVLVPPQREGAADLNVHERLTRAVVRVYEIPPERERPVADTNGHARAVPDAADVPEHTHGLAGWRETLERAGLFVPREERCGGRRD